MYTCIHVYIYIDMRRGNTRKHHLRCHSWSVPWKDMEPDVNPQILWDGTPSRENLCWLKSEVPLLEIMTVG